MLQDQFSGSKISLLRSQCSNSNVGFNSGLTFWGIQLCFINLCQLTFCGHIVDHLDRGCNCLANLWIATGHRENLFILVHDLGGRTVVRQTSHITAHIKDRCIVFGLVVQMQSQREHCLLVLWISGLHLLDHAIHSIKTINRLTVDLPNCRRHCSVCEISFSDLVHVQKSISVFLCSKLFCFRQIQRRHFSLHGSNILVSGCSKYISSSTSLLRCNRRSFFICCTHCFATSFDSRQRSIERVGCPTYSTGSSVCKDGWSLNCASGTHAVQSTLTNLFTHSSRKSTALICRLLNTDVLAQLFSTRLQTFFNSLTGHISSSSASTRNTERCTLKTRYQSTCSGRQRSSNGSSHQTGFVCHFNFGFLWGSTTSNQFTIAGAVSHQLFVVHALHFIGCLLI